MVNQHCKSILNAILLVWFIRPREISSLHCYSCQGINCQRTTKANETTTCPNQWDNCVTIFSGTTTTERGCFSTMPERFREKCDHPSSGECHKCSEDHCNNLGAVSCIQCSSKIHEDETCFFTPNVVEPTRCPISVGFNSYCFVRTTRGAIERGCLNNLREQVKCLDNPEQCKMCLPFKSIPCNDEIMAGSSQATHYGLAIVVVSLLVLGL